MRVSLCMILYCNQHVLHRAVGFEMGQLLELSACDWQHEICCMFVQELICQQHATAVPDDAEGYVSSHEYQRFVEQTVLQPLVVAGVGCIVVLVPATEFSSNSNLQGSTLEPCNDSQILIYLKVRPLLNSTQRGWSLQL